MSFLEEVGVTTTQKLSLWNGMDGCFTFKMEGTFQFKGSKCWVVSFTCN
jgi:hypothetical protein